MKIAVSKCLLGKNCRYDGKNKKNDYILSLQDQYELVAFCPEDDAFGTPRDTIRVVKKDNTLRVIRNSDNKDLSNDLMKKIEIIANDIISQNISTIILKSKSPSCGYKSVKIYDDKNMIENSGNGLFSEYISNNFKDIKLIEETNIEYFS
jgi:uncharacterized protein YbbK (DUF523 family)